jgi:hypothetical protein
MKKLLLLLGLLVLFFGVAFAQSPETVSTNDFSLRDDIDNQYNLIRTDQNGDIVWSKPINKNNNPFDYSQGTYIVCGFTEVTNGRIIDNPCDYDYWIVRISETIQVSVYPNPVASELNIALNSYVNELDFCLLDINLKLIESTKLTNYITTIPLPQLANGIYMYEVTLNNKLIKTGKICVIQND